MNSDRTGTSDRAGVRDARGPRGELDRLVEGELAALLAEQAGSQPPPSPPADPADRFIEEAVAFLAGRADRDHLLARLQVASAAAEPRAPAEAEQTKPEPE